MRDSLLLLGVVVLIALLPYISCEEKKLQIGVKQRVDPENCKIKSKKGDVLHMHYTVK